MIAAVADTHAVVWYLFGDSRLSSKARESIEGAARHGRHIAVSAITLAELIYLIEKKRLPGQVFDRLLETLRGGGVFLEVAFDVDVAQTMKNVSRDQIPDLPDRLIAATGLHLRVPVISGDARIRASDIETIW